MKHPSYDQKEITLYFNDYNKHTNKHLYDGISVSKV